MAYRVDGVVACGYFESDDGLAVVGGVPGFIPFSREGATARRRGVDTLPDDNTTVTLGPAGIYEVGVYLQLAAAYAPNVDIWVNGLAVCSFGVDATSATQENWSRETTLMDVATDGALLRLRITSAGNGNVDYGELIIKRISD